MIMVLLRISQDVVWKPGSLKTSTDGRLQGLDSLGRWDVGTGAEMIIRCCKMSCKKVHRTAEPLAAPRPRCRTLEINGELHANMDLDQMRS